ncbi:dTDP-glucose 4,6-dehydratase [Sutterella sp.]|uniref:dTDP-glucose 4,6-dehydratase n=1 Tax=Sutterella sp. TaxID=1981025 RepID=UPI0026DF00B9|nr:dTDP-glucose 4,6-dehydratase [Sutterella sp.]MDO5531358.1 dTDP-glucose 4,6-dehydratase [Sutterella sp.]
MSRTLLVTGGAGFIGSAWVLSRLAAGDRIINLDLLTYSGNPENLAEAAGNPAHVFVKGDIGDEGLVKALLETHRPDAVVNFAAETHVDRSILDPDRFVRTNVLGTSVLLRTVRDWWLTLPEERRAAFRFLHISTDEVYGSLGPSDAPFTESTPLRPNSPYAASKAAADHFVRAWHETYGLPVLITRCSNNYGPRQFPEKLIPLMILSALEGKPLPVYGTGGNIRDWLHVEDHCEALALVLERGQPGGTWNIGGGSGRTNMEAVGAVCSLLDELRPRADGRSYLEQIRHVEDRAGHDFRYATDFSRITRELGWRPRRRFEEGLAETVRWYLGHPQWVRRVVTGEYRAWLELNYAGRADAAP